VTRCAEDSGVDIENRFHTRASFALARLDYAALLVLLLALAAVHAGEIRWGAFALAFWWIDAVGYWPGALAYRLQGGGPGARISPLFHHLYNAAHSAALNLGVLGLWYLVNGGAEWAMLAQPIHLCIDRGVFGNTYKPRELAFEPVAHAGFAELSAKLEAARW
jgi:hypothetical protein